MDHYTASKALRIKTVMITITATAPEAAPDTVRYISMQWRNGNLSV